MRIYGKSIRKVSIKMALLKNEYKSFLDDLEKNIKNKEDLEYIKERFTTFIDSFLKQMNDAIDYKEEKLEQLESSQKDLDERMAKMQQVLDNIEKDIYTDEGFDFEIVCPYCSNEFIIDIDENKTEIQCPECNNTIELDWTGDIDEDGCNGSCHSCHGCHEEEEEEEIEKQDDEDM